MNTRDRAFPSFILSLLWAAATAFVPALAAPVSLFDGTSFAGWEGRTNDAWRIRDGAIIGGSLAGNPRNEFLATTRAYRNFRLRLEYRLVGTEGFVNGGVQFRSRRIAQPPNEMSGFQADIGAGFSGCLYDESRRNRMLAMADTNLVTQIERPGDWNQYEILAQGPEVVLALNGRRTAVWVERESGIDGDGVIALQIHGNCKAEISFRNVTIEELPDPAVPPEAAVLGRFGDPQPAAPIPAFERGQFRLGNGEVFVLVGQENLVRDQKSGAIESVLARGLASTQPRFRPMAWEADTVYEQWRDLNFGPWSRQLEAAGATIVLAQYGQMEALDGPSRLPEFIAAYHRLLDQFATRTRRIVLVSPIPFERPLAPDAPDLRARNDDVARYSEAVREIASKRSGVFVDLFTALKSRSAGSRRLTEDGIHLTEEGLMDVARVLGAQLGIPEASTPPSAELREAIVAKNRLWFDCWRPANWSFVYGDRVSQAYGKSSGGEPALKEAFERRRPLIRAADERIAKLAAGQGERLEAGGIGVAAAGTAAEALTPEAELDTFTVAEGYQVNLFASERDGVIKPTQISWDERGRLLVACSPTYPQTQASSSPADFILVLEDSDGDGRADRGTRYAEGLTMVQGVEPGAGGVYACDFDQLIHLRDADGDGRAEQRQVILSGFGIGDTHQLVNSVSHGPDGSLWMSQGLHAFSRVETPWGIARLDRAGIWRFQPRTFRLEGFFGGGMAGANCWGVAFDDYGQVFHKSGDRPHGYWSVPGLVRGASPLGSGSTTSADVSYRHSPEQYHSVGPLFETSPKTTSLDIIGTQGLPEDIQGCAVIGGYFGAVVELHRFHDAGSGFRTTQLPRLLKSSNQAFRPVDVSVGPDGAIYLADWFNPVIGHYQASYADPRRDKTHGRIWRISARGRPPVRPPRLTHLDPAALLGHLRSPERWVRYQAKRLLFDAPTTDVLKAADAWIEALPPSEPGYERLLLEVCGVYEAHGAPRPALVARLADAVDPRVRAYGARVAGAWAAQMPGALKRLHELARDPHPRVRLEAAVAASYCSGPEAVTVATEVFRQPRDPFIDYAVRQSARALQPQWAGLVANGVLAPGRGGAQTEFLRQLLGTAPTKSSPGQLLYDMACLPCHQPEGRGLPGVYPPLAGSDWVRGEPGRLIRILLHGLSGPIRVSGADFGGPDSVPMPSMGGLTDEQIADVLTHVRREFGGGASAVSAAEVGNIRKATREREAPWTAAELQ